VRQHGHSCTKEEERGALTSRQVLLHKNAKEAKTQACPLAERKRMGEALQRSEEQLRAYIDQASDLIFTLDALGKITSVNRMACKVTGYSAEELLGSNSLRLVTETSRASTEQALRDILSGKSIDRVEVEILSKDKRQIWLEVRGRLITERGKITRIFQIARDITERRRMIEQIRTFSQFLSAAVNNSPDLIFIKDRNLRYVVVSDRACDFVGRPREEILGRTAQELYPKDFADSIERTDREVLEKGAAVDVPGMTGVHGEEYAGRTWHTKKAPLREASGNITHVISITRDTTERKRMEEELRRLARFPLENPNPVLRLSKEGVVLDANPGSELVLRSWGSRVGGEASKTWRDFVSDALKSGTSRSVDVVLGERVYLFTIVPVKDTNYANVYGRDITERKQREEALRSSEIRYMELAESISDVFFAMDSDLRYTYWNKASENLIGISAKDAIGKSIFDVFPDTEDTRRAVVMYREVLKTRQHKSFINEYRLGDKNFVFEIDVYPAEKGISIFIKDIADRKRMEEALKQSEKKLKALHGHARKLAVANTMEEVAKHTLDAMEFTLGFDVADFCTVEKDHIQICGSRGIPAANALREWPLDKPSVVVKSVYTKRTLRVPDTRKEPSFVDRRTFSATEKLQLSELAIPVLANGGVIAILNVESSRLNAFSDEDQELLETLAMHVGSALGRLKQVDELERLVEERTGELRASEEKYRLLVDNLTDVVFTIDLKGSITFGSSAAEKMTGYSVKQLLTMNMREVIAPEHFDEIQNRLQARMRGEKYLPQHQFDLIRADETRVPVEMSTAPLVTEGKLIGIQGILRDITERKRMDIIRDRFISAVTHELRTPLVSVKGYVDLALEESESIPEKVKSELQVAKRNTDRLLSLVNDLLDLSRMQSGKHQLDLQSMDFKQLIDHCAAEIQPFVNAKKQSLSLEVPAGPLPVQGDPVRLSQVLANLLSNASKFAPEGGGITVCVKDDADTIQVQVSDNGMGIRKEDLKRVFEPFAAIEKPTYVKGTGLGLSVSKGLVEAHGGKIWAESPGEGKGVTFTFTLPKNSADYLLAQPSCTPPLPTHR
jgi:PAS domain S-box-containing protein